MLKLRLARIGRKNYPLFRIVVMDSKTSPTGRAISVVGFYNPMTKALFINQTIKSKWLSVGVQPTKIVATLFKKNDKEETTR